MTEAKALERRRDALNRTIEVIRKRIDELGTTEPTIQRQGESRVLVQVPGFDDPDRLKKIIRNARLSMWQLWHWADQSIQWPSKPLGRLFSQTISYMMAIRNGARPKP